MVRPGRHGAVGAKHMISGAGGSHEGPLNLAEFERLAAERLPPMAYDYY